MATPSGLGRRGDLFDAGGELPVTPSRLILQPAHWYGWQMLPGYGGHRNVPYFSPIYTQQVKPLKTGRRQLRMSFLNVLYAAGVQDMSLELRVVVHAADYLVTEVEGPDEDAKRVGIVSHIEFEWVRRFCPELWAAQPPTKFGSAAENSVSQYLDAAFSPPG